MHPLSHIDFGRKARRLRVDTLVRLRWLAVVGQTATILVVHYGLQFPVPLAPSFIAIAASVWLNIGLRLRYETSRRLEDGPATLLLAYDILQLTALLFLTGGLQNPFAVLFLAPIMISAMSLSLERTLALVALMILAATTLAFYHLPLPWLPPGSLSLPLTYLAGIWLALASGALFIAGYAFRVAEEARTLSDALSATELVLAREKHLTQLDGLAAAAAHELGTPLATITLIARDLRKEVAEDESIYEDVALLEQEVQRCRTILGRLASLGADAAADWQDMSLRQLLEEVADPSRNFGVEIVIDATGEGPEPRSVRNPGILYGLGNLVENAVDFATASVRIEARWTDARVRVQISDDGPGFGADVLGKLGEPYISTRNSDRRAKVDEGGLGLGLFIAKTLLERSGAIVSMGNAEPPLTGATIAVVWPRVAFESKPSAQEPETLENARSSSRSGLHL